MMQDNTRDGYEEYSDAMRKHAARTAPGDKTLAAMDELMGTTNDTKQKFSALGALYGSGKNIYAGTVPQEVVEQRRAQRKRARAARKINRRK